MKVLVITGDKKFVPGNPRYDLQAGWVDAMAVVYWGRGSLRPNIPDGPFDVVTVQDPFWRGLFALWVARKLHVACNVQVHADIDGQSFIKRLIARVVLRRADTIRVVSDTIKKQVERFGVMAPILVLPVYITIAKFSAVARRPHAKATILWIGRFEEEKNPLAAIEVLLAVRHAGVEAQLIMLGEGALADELKTKASGLADVQILGWQQDILPFLETADVVLSTSWYESWGASIVEALAAGVPVVAPDVGVAREAGAIVVPREKLAEAVVDVLQHDRPGTLLLKILSAKEWAALWRENLLSSRVKA